MKNRIVTLAIKNPLKLFVFVLIIVVKTYSQTSVSPINTLKADFLRQEIDENGKHFLTEGSIFFSAPDKVWIWVHNPVNQQILIADKKMHIFYPLSNSVFNINSEKPISLSFLTPFIAALRNDYGLSELKYSVLNFEMIKDTLISIWHPHEVVKEYLGVIEIKTVSEKVFEVTKFAPDKDEIMHEIRFSDHVQLNDIFWLPTVVALLVLPTKSRHIYC